jgi:hypothetical protein
VGEGGSSVSNDINQFEMQHWTLLQPAPVLPAGTNQAQQTVLAVPGTKILVKVNHSGSAKAGH